MSKLLVLCATCITLGVAWAEASVPNEVVVMATGGTIAGASADRPPVPEHDRLQPRDVHVHTGARGSHVCCLNGAAAQLKHDDFAT